MTISKNRPREINFFFWLQRPSTNWSGGGWGGGDKKVPANRLKTSEPVKHIMKKEDDDNTKMFSKSTEKFGACEAYQAIIFYISKHFQQLSCGFKNLISWI